MFAALICRRWFAAAGIFLWLSVVGMQITHDWTHLHGHSHDHSHHVCAPVAGTAIASSDACPVCDWDWFPTEAVSQSAALNASTPWIQRLQIGGIQLGFLDDPRMRAQDHRGPPHRG